MDLVDLHVHSSASDGTFSPSEVTALALRTGLKAYALTDHDTTDGIAEAAAAAAGTGLEVVPGTELSCLAGEKEIHMLGLYLDPEAPEFAAALARLRADRERRNEEMLRRFQNDGFLLTMDDLAADEPDAVITRAHFARALLKKGYVTSMDQAFRHYLDHTKKYCPVKQTVEPNEAIRLIRSAGGFPALAHPIQYKLGWKKTEELIASLKDAGLMGVEVYYSSHTQNDSMKLQEICRRYRLLPTGGSDFHGSNKPDISLGSGRGRLRVSALLLDDIRERLDRNQPL